MGLFKPAYETDNPNKIDKAIASLSKVPSEQELAVIYKKAPLDEVAYAALARIKSQQVLRDLLRDYRWRNRDDLLKILARIDDVSLLKDIVQEGKGKTHFDMDYWVCDTIPAAFEKLPEPDIEEVEIYFNAILNEDKCIEWIEHLKYPEDRELLCGILNLRLVHTFNEAAAKKIPASEEPELVKEVLRTGPDGSAIVFIDCLKMPEDKDLLMDMLQRGDEIRIKAAEILAQDETMRDYSFCPYCGRPASSISYGYRGLFNDMFYYGWSCPCGHTNSVPEGYGEPDSFAVTIAEFAEDPDRYKK